MSSRLFSLLLMLFVSVTLAFCTSRKIQVYHRIDGEFIPKIDNICDCSKRFGPERNYIMVKNNDLPWTSGNLNVSLGSPPFYPSIYNKSYDISIDEINQGKLMELGINDATRISIAVKDMRDFISTYKFFGIELSCRENEEYVVLFGDPDGGELLYSRSKHVIRSRSTGKVSADSLFAFIEHR